MDPSLLIEPLGYAGFVFLLLAAISGYALLKFNIRWLNISVHMWIGITAVIMGTLHLVIIFMANQ